MKLTIRHFGAFRKYGPSSVYEAPAGTSVKQLKALLSRDLGIDYELLNESAVAREDEVVGEETILNDSCNLALLPPVCGG